MHNINTLGREDEMGVLKLVTSSSVIKDVSTITILTMRKAVDGHDWKHS